MKRNRQSLITLAAQLGFRGKEKTYALQDWLRDSHQIHVEVGSIWDELNNRVESYFYTVTAPINIYFSPPVYSPGGKSHKEMLLQGLEEALHLLETHRKQNSRKVNDDRIVIAYLKGYGDKGIAGSKREYPTSIENYAYSLGKQGDYMEEGLTEDDIVLLVRNQPQEERLRLE